MLKNSYIFSLKNFLLTLTLLRIVEQSISSFISLALIIINMEIVVGLLLSSLDLGEAESLYIHEPL